MADTGTPVAVVGCTGLVGSHILSQLVKGNDVLSPVHALSRRGLPSDLTTVASLRPHISTDNSTWVPTVTNLAPPPKIFFSALGTTRGQAGSVEKQRSIDYDLNLSLAQAAKTAGATSYVLISTSGASSSSFVPYSKMKGQLEDEVQKLGFEHCVILRPGVIVGEREDSRPAEFVVRSIAKFAGNVSQALKDPWAQDAEVIARAAINAGKECIDGKREKGTWMLSQAEIVRLGKEEK